MGLIEKERKREKRTSNLQQLEDHADEVLQNNPADVCANLAKIC